MRTPIDTFLKTVENRLAQVYDEIHAVHTDKKVDALVKTKVEKSIVSAKSDLDVAMRTLDTEAKKIWDDNITISQAQAAKIIEKATADATAITEKAKADGQKIIDVANEAIAKK